MARAEANGEKKRKKKSEVRSVEDRKVVGRQREKELNKMENELNYGKALEKTLEKVAKRKTTAGAGAYGTARSEAGVRTHGRTGSRIGRNAGAGTSGDARARDRTRGNVEARGRGRGGTQAGAESLGEEYTIKNIENFRVEGQDQLYDVIWSTGEKDTLKAKDIAAGTIFRYWFRTNMLHLKFETWKMQNKVLTRKEQVQEAETQKLVTARAAMTDGEFESGYNKESLPPIIKKVIERIQNNLDPWSDEDDEEDDDNDAN